MSKLIDLIGLTNIANDIKKWVNDHFLRKDEAPAGSTPSATTPKMDGEASVGTENAFARGDHRHPSDTSKVDKELGKGLSTNDYDATAKAKVDAIPANPQYTDTVYDDTELAGRVSTIEGKESGWDAKQDALVSGTTIKTINGESILGSGNITISGGGGSVNAVLYTEQTLTSEQKEQARINIGAGTSSFSGSYNDLSDKPTLFSGDYDDLTNKPTIPAAQIQSDWSQSDNTAKDFIKNKPTIPAAQVNADWNASSGVAQILNKPTIPDISGKADAATTLAGYGITDAKIESGVITLGSNTITPLTSHQSLTNYVQKSQTAGLLKNDGTVDQTQYGTYSKPSNGIPASDLESGVIPTVPVQDVTVGGTSVVSNGTAVIPAIPDVTTKADKTLVASSMPSGGFSPNTVYNLGTLSGNTTFLMAAATDNTIANIWCWTFTTPSTAPTITWPAAITGWSGSSTPTINASKSYEVTVMNGLATIIES